MIATFDFPVRRLIAVGGLAAAIAVTPTIAVFAGPSPAIDAPMAACPPGEDEDPFTFICVPELVPAHGIDDPAPSERQVEQDVYDTPGVTVPHVGGTTVP
jgi:hypothetical protein